MTNLETIVSAALLSALTACAAPGPALPGPQNNDGPRFRLEIADDGAMTLEGVEIATELLSAGFAQIVVEDPEGCLIIDAHEDVRYAHVSRALAIVHNVQPDYCFDLVMIGADRAE